MTRNQLIDSLLNILNTHIKRLESIQKKLEQKHPLTASQVETMKDEDLFLLEFLVSRFSKLQDFLGNQIFSQLLIMAGENIDSWTMLDKLNKLEKLQFIPSREAWLEMRLLRNHFSHEYPAQPELTAKYLNQAIESLPNLLEIAKNLKNHMLNLLEQNEDR